LQVFLPLINKPPIFLSGTITYRGAPVAGQQVELRQSYDDYYATIASATTDANGMYQVALPAQWEDDHSLYLRWLNTSDNDAWLSAWFCNEITVLPQNDISCSFDIQDIVLTMTPYNVTLPYTFRWTKRVTTSDSYQHNLFDPADIYQMAWSPLLGYTNSYTMTGLPAFLAPHTDYGWWMTAYGPDGAGESFYYILITFENRGLSMGSAGENGTLLRNTLHQDPPLH
jgi:hypothetical protein